MNFRQKLLYTALGALAMLIGMLAANLLNPITAQTTPQDATFGSITCNSVRLVDSAGNTCIYMNASDDSTSLHIGSGLFTPEKNTGHIMLSTNDNNAFCRISSSSPTSQSASISINCQEDNSSIRLHGGADNKNTIYIFTEDAPSLSNNSIEELYFGISMFDLAKSAHSRASMFIENSRAGGFSAHGPYDKRLWRSPRN